MYVILYVYVVMRRAASQVKAATEWGHPTRAAASFQIVHFKIIVPECCISSETFGTPNQEECHAHPPPRLPHPGVFPNSPIRASLEHDSNDAQHRLQILEFWATHGAAATHDAYQVSRRTLYRWKQTVTQAGGNPAALAALCHLLPVPPRYVLSDNGSAFLGHFQHRLEKRGITHWWTYPRSPKMNAHAERFNRTLQEQFVDYHEDLLFDDLATFNRQLADWLLF